MKSHTPGPWSINPKGGTPMVGIDLQDGGELLPIVEVVYGYNNAEAKANARLIAAAPELLEALDELANGYKGCFFDTGLAPRLEKARNAIANATVGASEI